MKEIKCTKCDRVIPIGEGYYNFMTGAQCSACGEELSKAIEKDWQKDPFGLIAAARLNKIRLERQRTQNNGKDKE